MTPRNPLWWLKPVAAHPQPRHDLRANSSTPTMSDETWNAIVQALSSSARWQLK